MAVGDIITATRYNDLQNRIAVIMGVGSGNSGYGQVPLSSSQRAVGLQVTVTDILNLRSDMIKARQHQTGVNEAGASFTFPSGSVSTADNSITINSHGYTDGTQVVLTNESDDGVSPGNLSYNSVYYVRDSAPNTFKLTSTSGGPAIDITTQGSGTHRIFSGFPVYTNSNKIKEADYVNLLAKIDLIETNKLVIGPGQSSIGTARTSQRTLAWNATITHAVTVDFGSANGARYFFNSGGEIRTRATITGYSGNIGDDWNTLLTNMGTIKFNHTETTSTGTGTGSAIGYYDLTTTDQTIFTKVGSGVYLANDYTVKARKDTTGRYVYLTITFNDDKVANPNFDESPGGTTTSYVEAFYATGTNVEVSEPSIATTTELQ